MAGSSVLKRFTPQRIIRSAFRRIGRPLKSPLPKGEAWSTSVDVAVICPSFPGKGRFYGGQFVQSRVMAYRRAGLSVVVITSREDCLADSLEQVEGVPVWRTNPAQLSDYLEKNLSRRLVLHHPEKANWNAVRKTAERTRPLLIFHGYEARPWRVLESSYSEAKRLELGPRLDVRDAERKATLVEIFDNTHALPVFVSETLRQTAEAFCGRSAPTRTEIIHNPVLSTEFPYQEKQVADRYSVLWLRSFRSFNYANDLSRDAILALTRRPDFNQFKITICGEGELWDELTLPLQTFENVTLRRGTIARLEVSELHSQHGIMLVPSRWESQGLTLCESMSSGLVAVTTAVAAVPEFISEKEGRVCLAEDSSALASAIGQLVDNPALFLELSKSAHLRSQAQCGLEKTASREIELLSS